MTGAESPAGLQPGDMPLAAATTWTEQAQRLRW